MANNNFGAGHCAAAWLPVDGREAGAGGEPTAVGEAAGASISARVLAPVLGPNPHMLASTHCPTAPLAIPGPNPHMLASTVPNGCSMNAASMFWLGDRGERRAR